MVAFRMGASMPISERMQVCVSGWPHIFHGKQSPDASDGHRKHTPATQIVQMISCIHNQSQGRISNVYASPAFEKSVDIIAVEIHFKHHDERCDNRTGAKNNSIHLPFNNLNLTRRLSFLNLYRFRGCLHQPTTSILNQSPISITMWPLSAWERAIMFLQSLRQLNEHRFIVSRRSSWKSFCISYTSSVPLHWIWSREQIFFLRHGRHAFPQYIMAVHIVILKRRRCCSEQWVCQTTADASATRA